MANVLTDVERTLVVVAHPDDVDFGAAATIAGWVDSGVEVRYCLVTRGDAGGFDDTPRERMPALREEEQRAAAAEVGVKDVAFLGYPDGQVYLSHELRRDLTRQIRRFRPDRVLTHSPQRNWQRIGISHPDHLAVGEATLCAVYPDARNQFAHPELLATEGLDAWTVREVWLMGAPEPDHVVDVTDTFDRKVAALRRHASQTSHMPDLAGMIRGWLTFGGARGGLPEGRLGEMFQVVSTG
ncbi:MAG TPA: PIG-L deacetylase family protein [Mycobacteriales bacterium]|nr:PIG-L deacetylase family protein [Mycobacteriales bacterium]